MNNKEHDYCRLCAKLIIKTELINIKSYKINLETRILQCFQLKILENDNLPKSVCTICESKINNFFEFSEQILQAQRFFETELYQLSDIKPPVSLKLEEDNYYNELNSEYSFGDNAADTKTNSSEDCDVEKNGKVFKVKISFNLEEIRQKYKDLIIEWPCLDCADSFSSEHDLSTHYMTIHKTPVQYKCVVCLKQFNNATTFWKHAESHVKDNSHRCDICKNYYSSAAKLKYHIETHQSVRKKYQCNVCGKSFLKECILELHRRKHDDIEDDNRDADKTFKCDECSKLFLSIYTLNNHKKTHKGIREHVCEHCGKRFWHKKYLVDHVKSHNEDRPYKCDLCSASFKVKMYLRKHRFLHSGIKKFQCDICGKKFPRKNGLVQHGVTHSESYPFQCDVCNRRFKMKRNYLGHKRTHTGEKPYSCVDCNKHFACAVSYDGHMEKNHGVIKVKKTLIEIKCNSMDTD